MNYKITVFLHRHAHFFSGLNQGHQNTLAFGKSVLKKSIFKNASLICSSNTFSASLLHTAKLVPAGILYPLSVMP